MGWSDVKAPNPPCKGECGWERYLTLLDEMLNDESYDYASAFLEEVELWIKKAKHVTTNQKKAIQRIKNKRSASDTFDLGGSYYDEFWKD